MRNQIITKNLRGYQGRSVRGLLERMEGDIVDPNGSLPRVNVISITTLRPGGSIYLDVENSRECFLETSCPVVRYYPRDSLNPARICYQERVIDPKKHAMKSRNYNLIIELLGEKR